MSCLWSSFFLLESCLWSSGTPKYYGTPEYYGAIWFWPTLDMLQIFVDSVWFIGQLTVPRTISCGSWVLFWASDLMMRPTYHLLAFIRSSLWNQEALKHVKLDDQMPALQVTETGFLFLQELSSISNKPDGCTLFLVFLFLI